MFVFGYIFMGLGQFVHIVCTILTWLIIARIIVSWLPVDPYHSVVQFLFQVTEPILAPFRRIPIRIGMLDLTPIMAVLVIQVIDQILLHFFYGLAHQMGVS